MHRGWSASLANKMSCEYYLVVSYEIILYQDCKFSAASDKYGKEAIVGGAIQLYKIFKGTQSPIIPTLVLFALCLYTAIIYIGC